MVEDSVSVDDKVSMVESSEDSCGSIDKAVDLLNNVRAPWKWFNWIYGTPVMGFDEWLKARLPNWEDKTKRYKFKQGYEEPDEFDIDGFKQMVFKENMMRFVKNTPIPVAGLEKALSIGDLEK